MNAPFSRIMAQYFARNVDKFERTGAILASKTVNKMQKKELLIQ